MNTWNSLTPLEMHDFRMTLQAWLDLRICSTCALEKRAGLSTRTVYDLLKFKNTTHKTADELMRAIGEMEKRHINQWRADRRVES